MGQEPPAGPTPIGPKFSYAVKFLCGPSSESFQEGMVTGFAATAINILNPSLEGEVRFVKRASRALPYQTPGPASAAVEGSIGPLEAIEVECNEIRQLLPSSMTEEFRTGFLMILSEARLEVTAVYSARPRDGEVATIDIETIVPTEMEDPPPPDPRVDLTVDDIDIAALRNSCPTGGGSCVAIVPVTISNIGAGDAGSFNVRVTFDPSQSVMVDRPFSGLAAGAGQTFPAQTPPGGNCYDPDCTICAVVDSANEVPETDETNNQLCRTRDG